MTEIRRSKGAPGAEPGSHSESHNESNGWRAIAMRRWPVLLAVVVSAILGVWAMLHHGRGTGQAITAQSEASAGKDARSKRPASPDSLVLLDSASLGLVDIEIATVGAGAGGALVANGTITFDANQASAVAPQTEGRVVTVERDLGQHVSKGTVLAILQSPDVGQTRGDVERARANLDVTQQNYQREQRLYAESISSQKELLEAKAAYGSARADANAAAAKIQSLGATSGHGATFGLVSPINGVVVDRDAMPGQTVGPSSTLFTVADLRRVWITVDLYESDVGRVQQGASAAVNPRALPGETFHGRVTYAGGVVDTASRTIKVRVEVENPTLRLRPGMFAQVRIEAPNAATAGHANANGTAAAKTRANTAGPVIIPDLAVQDVNGKPTVFLPGRRPGQFIARAVTLGARPGDGTVTITQGLRVGERIVVKGAFQLKAEMMKASFGDDDS